MYSEIRQSGKKQFLFAIIMMLAMYFIGSFINYALAAQPIIRFSALIVMCCVIVYILYRRYSARYTYILDDKEITIQAAWGHKVDEFKISYKKIDMVLCGKQRRLPWSKKNYCVSIMPNSDYCYIIYGEGKKALVIEPSDEFLDKLKEHIK